MNSNLMNQYLLNIYNKNNEKVDSMRKLYDEYIVYTAYFITKILSEEKDVHSYVYRSFDKTFKYCEENKVELTEFEYELKKSSIQICDNVLKSKIGEYNENWTSVDYGFLPDIYESNEMGLSDASLYSDTASARILNMMRNLPVQEKILALAYYYLELSITDIARILEVEESVIFNLHKSIKYNIETNYKFINNTVDSVEYSKNIIKMYFYNEQTSLKTTILKQYADDDLFFEQYEFTKGRIVENTENNSAVNEEKKNNKKKKNPLFPLLIVVLVFVIAIIVGLVFIIVNNSKINNSVISNTIETTKEKVLIYPNGISFNDKEIYLCVGDEFSVNPIITPHGCEDSILINIKDNSSDSWYYTILNDSVISYDSLNMKIKALKAGDAIFGISSGKYTNDSGEFIKDSIKVHVIDKIETFDFEDDVIVVVQGEYANIDINILPESAYNGIVWASLDENIVKIESGKVKGINIGEGKIRAQVKTLTEEGTLSTISIETNVKVIKPLDTSVVVRGMFNEKIHEMIVGQKYLLGFSFTPSEDYVYLKIVAYDNATYAYDSASKTIIPLKEGTLLIYLYNGVNKTEHLDSFMVKIVNQGGNE